MAYKGTRCPKVERSKAEIRMPSSRELGVSDKRQARTNPSLALSKFRV